MLNINKRNLYLETLLTHSYNKTKITIYFSTESVGTDFDKYEKNYTYTNLNPHTFSGYTREIEFESLAWRQIGTQETGAKELICSDKYKDWLKNCNKLTIDGDDYEVYKEALGSRVIIQERPFKLIRVIVRKK